MQFSGLCTGHVGHQASYSAGKLSTWTAPAFSKAHCTLTRVDKFGVRSSEVLRSFMSRLLATIIWVVVKMTFPFWVLSIIRHLVLRGPIRAIIFTTTHIDTHITPPRRYSYILPSLITHLGSYAVAVHVRSKH